MSYYETFYDWYILYTMYMYVKYILYQYTILLGTWNGLATLAIFKGSYNYQDKSQQLNNKDILQSYIALLKKVQYVVLALWV